MLGGNHLGNNWQTLLFIYFVVCHKSFLMSPQGVHGNGKHDATN